jgi:hypothetical protein
MWPALAALVYANDYRNSDVSHGIFRRIGSFQEHVSIQAAAKPRKIAQATRESNPTPADPMRQWRQLLLAKASAR